MSAALGGCRVAELLSGRGGKIRKGRGRDGRRRKGGTILFCLWLQDIINLKGRARERRREVGGGEQRFANLHLTNPNLGNYFVYQTSLIPNDELFFKEKNDPW